MAAPAVLFSCIARAAAKHAANFLTFGLAGDILTDAWDAWQKEADEAQRRLEAGRLAAASPADAREAARRALAECRLSPRTASASRTGSPTPPTRSAAANAAPRTPPAGR